jgi:tetratricopeptide (TPR) repeat protein
MYRKHFFISLVAAAIFILGGVSAFAQIGSIRGKILLKQADGKTAPVPNAVIDLYRIDIPGKTENIKTNKNGEFTVLGLARIGKYVMAISAPNASPKIRTNFKAGGDEQPELEVTLDPGNGARYTMEEAKAIAAGDKASGGTGPSSADTAKNEELKRKNAEILEGNKKIENVNTLYNNSFKNGNAALSAGDVAYNAQSLEDAEAKYTEAITRYDEALTADPTHPGAPALMTNKAGALKARGVTRYILAFKLTGDARLPGIEAAKKDFRDAADVSTKSVQMLKEQEVPADPAGAENYKATKFNAIETRAESMRLFVTKVDKTKLNDGDAAYQEYIALIVDPEKKLKAQLNEAKMFFDGDDMDKAVTSYQKILVEHPDNIDAMLYTGLALFNLQDATKFQEAANYLQRFVDAAPDTHLLKKDAKDVLEALKQQNVKPQKPTGRKRG